jgi:hypothetical protein
MGRCLVVADQTSGGERLMQEIRGRLAGGSSSFYVLVPETAPAQGTGASAFEADAHPMWMPAAPDDSARRRATLTAQSRLQHLVAQIRAAGGDARGELGNSDPIQAIAGLLGQGEQFDEIIISTLPAGVSGWLRMDVPRRVERKFKVPVTTVTAKG